MLFGLVPPYETARCRSCGLLRSWHPAAVCSHLLPPPVRVPRYLTLIPLVDSGVALCRHSMAMDQRLRETLSADSNLTNPFYYLQKQYKRLYYKFRSSYVFWYAFP